MQQDQTIVQTKLINEQNYLKEKTYDAYEAVNNLKETYQEDKQANLENQLLKMEKELEKSQQTPVLLTEFHRLGETMADIRERLGANQAQVDGIQQSVKQLETREMYGANQHLSLTKGSSQVYKMEIPTNGKQGGGLPQWLLNPGAGTEPNLEKPQFFSNNLQQRKNKGNPIQQD
ncbi:uncharacterized protein LOC111705535 [Eurytemora carolleeae]|uniref:uncharacterized protein LOC111705535 n=1 Tax=Eurytemora carolleeae TaxID=1294199 RepID=UPI000C76E17B|nr:uncharacterized protein LOC111705535 [Eurytemora carolleeae]|eukprot:XP_023333886.1 uncharacterized protein LOC111705535 [Eurytemora affinis]